MKKEDLRIVFMGTPEFAVETLQALVDIVRAGKALYVGISRWPLEATRFAAKYLNKQLLP